MKNLKILNMVSNSIAESYGIFKKFNLKELLQSAFSEFLFLLVVTTLKKKKIWFLVPSATENQIVKYLMVLFNASFNTGTCVFSLSFLVLFL